LPTISSTSPYSCASAALSTRPADRSSSTRLRGCPVTHRIGDLVFVHAGIDPQRPLAQQDRRALLWIRDPFLDWPGPFPEGVAVIHGHTPADRLDLDHPHRIDVDTGAFATGCLSAVLIHGDRMRGLRVWRP